MNEDLFFLGVKALIINESHELLVLKNHKGFWDLPGGRVAKGETLEETLARELSEEVGIKINNAFYLGTALSNIRITIGNLNAGLIIRLYHVTAPSTEAIVLSDEHISFHWLPMESALSLFKERFSEQFLQITKKYYQENALSQL